jgi:hypothetical protein
MPKEFTTSSQELSLEHGLIILFGILMFALAVLAIVLIFNHPKDWVRQKVGKIAAFYRQGMSVLFETTPSDP